MLGKSMPKSIAFSTTILRVSIFALYGRILGEPVFANSSQSLIILKVHCSPTFGPATIFSLKRKLAQRSMGLFTLLILRHFNENLILCITLPKIVVIDFIDSVDGKGYCFFNLAGILEGNSLYIRGSF